MTIYTTSHTEDTAENDTAAEPSRGAQSQIETTVREYLPLVRQIASRFHQASSVNRDDLVQVGALGLLKAIQGYDRERCKNASFRSYATLFIRGEIRHYLRDQASLVQQPRRVADIASRLGALEEQLTRELEREPTVFELASRSGLARETVAEFQQARAICNFYEPIDGNEPGEERGHSLSETIPDWRQMEVRDRAELRAVVRSAVRGLGGTSRQTIECVYFNELSQKETARLLGWSEMKVSRAIKRALIKLKAVLLTEIF